MNDAPPDDSLVGQDGQGAPSSDGALSVSAGREIREAEVKKAVSEILGASLRSIRPAEKQEVAMKIASMVVTQEEIYSGDVPHPAHLRGFEEIVPGSAKKIIDNAMSESEHRRSWEDHALTFHFRLASRAQICGLVLSILLIVGGFVLGLMDKTIVACAMLVPGVLGTAFNLIKASQQQKDERSSQPPEPPRSTSSRKAAARQQVSKRK